MVGIGLNRARRDFSDGQLQLVELLYQHLPAVFSYVGLRASLPTPSDYGLTPREAELWTLLNDGVSSAEMGAQLFISRRTVEKHLENLYLKLGVRSRWAAVALMRSPRKRD